MNPIEMLKNFWKDEQGTASVEWILVAALVVVVAIAAWQLLGTNVSTKVNAVATALG